MAKQPANKLRLKSVTIDGFKSLRGVTIPFDDRATVLIGPNGSCKSTVLQALEFAQQFMFGQPRAYFEFNKWFPSDFIEKKRPLRMLWMFSHGSAFRVEWEFTWHENHGEASERISAFGTDGKLISQAQLKSGKVTFIDGTDQSEQTISENLRPSGSVFSFIDEQRFDIAIDGYPNPVKMVRIWVLGMRIVRLLFPPWIEGAKARQLGQPPISGIGIYGEYLANFMGDLDPAKRARLSERVKSVSSQVEMLDIRMDGPTVELIVKETFDPDTAIRATHQSGGTLRLAALSSLAEMPSEVSMVAVDEVENGIDPHIIEKLIRSVVNDCDQQFLFTSHSPDLVNHFGPDQIVVLARGDDGRTLAAPMSAMPKAVKAMKYAGPAVIWTGASLKTLSRWVKEGSKETVASP